MRSYLLTLGLLLLLPLFWLSCGAGRKTKVVPYKPDSKYMTWFFNTPQGMVVGYPSRGDDPYQDGKVRLSGYAKTRVKGFLRQFTSGKMFDEQDSVYFYYDVQDSAILKQAIVLDSFFVSKYYVYLMSTDSGVSDDSQMKIYEKSRVGWLDNLPEDTQRLFARGSEKFLYYDQASSWMKAEEGAIKKLCQYSAYHFASLQKYEETGLSSRVSETYQLSLDLWVKNIQVVERYYDPLARTCNVLVSCRKSDIVRYQGEAR